MKILVIGGSGFIGTALVGRLIDLGYERKLKGSEGCYGET
jgi:uncharacterized protein YbjT (DUF2867 family)